MASNITLTYNSKPIHGCTKKNNEHRLYPKSSFLSNRNLIRSDHTYRKINDEKRISFTIYAVTKGSAEPSKSDETVPSWAKPGSDESPPWAREEGEKPASEAGFEPPFFVYLLASAFSAIAAIGSIFEYSNQKPVFGVVNPDSVFYAPLLGFFVFAGLPGSAYLWLKSVQVANKESEEQDRRDGYR